MRILVVDDENLARARLVRLLENAADEPEKVALAGGSQLEVVGEASNGHEAVKICEQGMVDLVLLDIRMPGMDGLETARHLLELDTPPAVVFCTAYEEHAIAAFDLQAVGYLLKPVRAEKLLAAIGKAQRLNRVQLANLSTDQPARRTHISARTHRGLELISMQQVKFFQADQKYVTVRYEEGEVIVDETLRDLENEFEDLLIRVHRNALVAKAQIDGLVKDSQGQPCLRMKGITDTVDISRRHLPAVRKVVKAL